MTIEQNEKFKRQPALRLFAAELAESKQTITEHVDGRDYDSRYQLTPSGVKVKRVFMTGVLVEVDNVESSGDYLRGRIIDPTGAFNVYAGQYQPDALRALSGFTIPCFVAVVGKANAYRPDEKTTIVSIRPETIVEIDAKTRDYWIKETVSRTIERVERSQLPETEKEKYRQICRNALTKLIDLPQEISKYLPEIPKEPMETTASAEQTVPTEPHQGDIPASPLIEQSIRKDEQSDEVRTKILSLMIEVSDRVPQKVVSYIELVETAREILGIKEETAIEAIKRLMDEGRCNEPIVGFLHPIINEEEPLAASSSTSEIDTERDSENLNPQEIKEHKTRLNNPVKSRKRKKKTEEKVMRKTQKALFPSE
ncbi:MAG: hypothetical protein FIB07_06550 [Candidatus Methanoperedens sp.]|nr:hypothetical protein [Candidatus Methanoperedens sp.]